MRRLADGYTTFAEVYRYILTDGLIDGEISKPKATLKEPPEVVVVPLTNYELQDLANSAWRDWFYEDRLSDAISDELWTSKSAELQEELRRVRTEMERHEGASQAYETAGLQILELAQTAYSSYVARKPREQARLLKTVVSNSTFDRGSLSPTYVKPFDVFANGGKTGDWLTVLDDFRNWLIKSS